MGIIILLWFDKFKGILIAVALGVAAVFATYTVGRRTAETEDELEDIKEFVETKERIDAVTPSTDRDAAIKRLRDNGSIR